jgi:anti-sigma-K factor RskA
MKQVPDHDEIETLLALRALGGGDADDDRRLEEALAAHRPCATCDRLRAETNDAAGRLPFADPPRALRDGFEERVMRALPVRTERRSRPRSVVRSLLAAALVAIVAFVAGWEAREVTAPQTPFDRLAGSNVVTLSGGLGPMTLAFHPGERGALLLGADVAEPPPGHVYELWLIRGGNPIAQGCFAPSGTGGTGPVLLAADGLVTASDTAAVTVESSACPSEPTTTPIASAPLSG